MNDTEEVVRIYQESMKKMERENERGEVVAVKGNERRKYVVMGVVCLVLMLVSMFAILSRKIESESKDML